MIGSANAKIVIVRGIPKMRGYFTDIFVYFSIRTSSFFVQASDMDEIIGREKAVMEKSTLETVSATL